MGRTTDIYRTLIGTILTMAFTLSCQSTGRSVTSSSAPALTAPPASIFHEDLALPRLSENEVLTRHTGFSLVYNTTHKNARWVAYELTRSKSEKGVDRTDKFLQDPLLQNLTATDNDYYKSGYDRGHLAPAADMSWSEVSMKESFYFSNISPQTPSFNRGIWKRLEEQVRTWAIEDSIIYMVTGPVLTENLSTIGNSVSVPELFYKAILVYKPEAKKGIGFILRNEKSSLPLRNFIVSIDSLQRLTGLDFFHHLPDEEEQEIETSVCVDCWNWKK
ncbi:MAG: DNA/RNA non-specific endonuclease [Cyclobacteriaceae bacterium]|nr:DNA/RNA non-specific endonuclease [Cyclobacteriaceae bacterium]